MSLKQAVAKKILNEVLIPLQQAKEWKVLVLDRLGTRIISSCLKMRDIINHGITLVEDMHKTREVLSIEAIYFLSPTKQSIEQLIKDFQGPHTQYKYAHVFFTEACPDDLFNQLVRSNCAAYLRTLKEINIAFLPIESRVVSLDSPEAFQYYFNATYHIRQPQPGFQQQQQQQNQMSQPSAKSPSQALEGIAEQIATLCATLGEYPLIRYRAQFDRNAEFAQMVQQKLDSYKAYDPQMGEGSQKDRSHLILLDRGFDPISPVLHELTFQAMVYDLLDIENDVYRYTNTMGAEENVKEIILDESIDLWCELRHQHVADVIQQVPAKLKQFSKEKRMPGSGEKTSINDFGLMIKKVPQYQRELMMYSLNLQLAEACMQRYNRQVKELCEVEQDLSMGSNAMGERVKDHMRAVLPILLSQSASVYDKLRIIYLYVVQRGGIGEDQLTRLINQPNIPGSQANVIRNLTRLGIPVIQDAAGTATGRRRGAQNYLPANRRISTPSQYSSSRWVPYLKDIIRDACDDKLDLKAFPYFGGGPVRSGPGGSGGPRPGGGGTPSGRYGMWHKDKNQQLRSGPRLIFFVIGGISYSEMRSAYEMANAAAYGKQWDILVGSTHISTPESYLDDLEKLSYPPGSIGPGKLSGTTSIVGSIGGEAV